MDLKVFNLDNVERAPEIIVYFLIESLGDFIYCMERAHRRYGADSVVLDDAEKARSDQRALVEMLKSRDGFGFADHSEYMRWYRWWNRWHKSKLDDEQWGQLNRLLKWDGTQTDETFFAWRPDGDWRETIGKVTEG